MSATTKEKALAKLHAVTGKSVIPTGGKTMPPSGSTGVPTARTRSRRDLEHNYNAAKLGKPVDRTEWEMTPQTYNAYYNPSNNEIVLPAAG